MNINITILFFAKAREIVGKSKATFEVNSKTPYRDLFQKIVEEFQLQPIKNNIILAHNQNYCDPDSVFNFQEGDEVAVVPPLSGG